MTIDALTPSVYVRSGLLVVSISVGVVVLAALLPPRLMSLDAIWIMGGGVVLSTLLYLVLASTIAQNVDPRKSVLKLVLAVWWFLLVSEQVFFRGGPNEAAFEGSFSLLAYAEAVMWAFAWVALLLILLGRPQYMCRLFVGPCKWLSLFALVCVLSVAYSPRLIYSMVWASKLVLVVLLLRVCSSAICEVNDVSLFLRTTFLAVLCLTVMPMARAFADPSTTFEGGRLNQVVTSPTALSAMAGTLLLLALTLNSIKGSGWWVGAGIFGVTAMILAGGKAGIMAGILSVAVFFVFQNRIGTGLAWLTAIITIGGIIVVVTPLFSYFRSYSDSGELSTLSSRTELWAAAWPAIMQRPIWGHGYVASRFVANQLPHVFQDAGHLHNGFLEVLYNNGLIGLVLLLPMHAIILRNVTHVIRRPTASGTIQCVAVGCLALYINLLINGLFNASFGGRPSNPFMLFLALVLISDTVVNLARQKGSPGQVQCNVDRTPNEVEFR